MSKYFATEASEMYFVQDKRARVYAGPFGTWDEAESRAKELNAGRKAPGKKLKTLCEQVWKGTENRKVKKAGAKIVALLNTLTPEERHIVNVYVSLHLQDAELTRIAVQASRANRKKTKKEKAA